MDLEVKPEDNWVTRLTKEVGFALLVDATKKVVLFVGASVIALVGLVIWQGGSVPAWLLLAVVVLLAAVFAAFSSRSSGALRRAIGEVEEERDECESLAADYEAALERHETYSGHVAVALDALQQVLTDEIDVALDHYIEVGVLEPARDLITDKPAEHVRLSVLVPRADDLERWTMVWSAGHTLTGKAKYAEKIVDTLARHAYESGEQQKWDDVEEDRSFRQNPKASHPTRAMLSFPIRWGERTVGVFNAVSSEPYAFDPAEERYLASLCAVIAVAMGAHLQEDDEGESPSSGGAAR